MKQLATAGLLAFALTGCATIIEGSTQPVTIKSVPDGASVLVTNRAGESIHNGTTPVTLTLKRGAGYFKSESYKVVVQKDGYAPKEVEIISTVNGWYIGNILFGGLIGMLAVDPATGAMYSFPNDVSASLEASQPVKTSDANSSLTIVSTESLPSDVLKTGKLVAAKN